MLTHPTVQAYQAELADPTDAQNTNGIEIASEPIEISPAFVHALSVAKQLYTLPKLLSIFQGTFDDDDKPSTEDVQAALVDPITVYTCNWTEGDDKVHIFHKSDAAAPVAVNNLFIQTSHWNALGAITLPQCDVHESSKVIMLIMQLFHELAHVITSVLVSRHVIRSHLTPLKATAFKCLEFMVHSDEGMGGERGFYMEAAAGGIVQYIADKRDQTKYVGLVVSTVRTAKPAENCVSIWSHYDMEESAKQPLLSGDAEQLALNIPFRTNRQNEKTLGTSLVIVKTRGIPTRTGEFGNLPIKVARRTKTKDSSIAG